MEQSLDLRELLPFISPSNLSYQEWVNVGMALKDSGYSTDDWDSWSRSDGRYHEGECAKKWAGFNGSATPVTGGTIVQMAKEGGWKSSWRPTSDGGHELSWDDIIGDKDEMVVVNTDWIEGREVKEPAHWDPVAQLTKYLETLFEASETVGYVTESYQKDGRYLPTKGAYDRTAGQLIEALSKCEGDMGLVIGDYKAEAGAWIRFNPLDGKGVKNENVSEYHYALVESDDMDIEKQNAIIRELELPVACLTHSGGKSLHAIVKVDAIDYPEYKKRVDYLYTVLAKNGMSIDTQNKNPSRLSRMPGITRNGNKQFLIDTNLGKESFESWKEWIESINDELPDTENLSDFWDNLPDLSPPLIDGLLRQGHKMLLAGPSKAGKSYSLIALCIGIAEGVKWLGFNCTQGKVLYINLELDRASCLHRFKDVYTALGLNPTGLKNLDVWNLRGKSVPMDKLAPKLIRRAMKKNYLAIVIDPIYKIITGDENSADQMAHFCNQFDKVCTELGCAVIYCHHHSKGGQNGKKSMDRASGSGVFARDPDALLDMSELELSESIKAQKRQKAAAAAYEWYMTQAGVNWQDEASQDDRCSERAMAGIAAELLRKDDFQRAEETAEQWKVAADRATAWRIEGTLREYPKFNPVDLWFDYPIHSVDQTGALADIHFEEKTAPWKKNTGHRKTAEEKQNDREDALELAYSALSIDGAVSVKSMEEYMGKSTNTVRKYIDESDVFCRKDGFVLRGQF